MGCGQPMRSVYQRQTMIFRALYNPWTLPFPVEYNVRDQDAGSKCVLSFLAAPSAVRTRKSVCIYKEISLHMRACSMHTHAHTLPYRHAYLVIFLCVTIRICSKLNASTFLMSLDTNCLWHASFPLPRLLCLHSGWPEAWLSLSHLLDLSMRYRPRSQRLESAFWTALSRVPSACVSLQCLLLSPYSPPPSPFLRVRWFHVLGLHLRFIPPSTF